MRFRSIMLTMGMLAVPGGLLSGTPAGGATDEFKLVERLERDWAPAWVSWPVDLPKGTYWPGRLGLATTDGKPIEYVTAERQVHDDGSVRGAVFYVYTGLHAGETKTFRVLQQDKGEQTPLVSVAPAKAGQQVLATDRIRIQTTAGVRSFDPPVDSCDVPAPILAVGCADGPWVGAGRLVDIGKIREIETDTDTSSPHRLTQEIRYHLIDNRQYTVRLTLTAHEPAVLVEEDFSTLAAGALVLDLHPGLEPTMGHGRGRLHPPGTGNLTSGYEIDFSKAWIGRIQPFYAWWNDYGLWWAAYRPGGQYVGILPLNPPAWTNPPPNPIQIHTGPDNKVEAFLPLVKGTRKWALVLARGDDALKRSAGGANLMMRTAIGLGQNPLDKVKDLDLTWTGMQDIDYPHLLCTPADVPAIRKKVRTHPLFKEVFERCPDKPDDPAGLYLATGDEKHAREAIDDLVRQLKGWLTEALDGSHYGEGLNAIGFTRPLRRAALVFDLVAGSKSMTRDERDYCLRAFAFLAYCLADENRWPARYQGFARGNVNFHSDDYTCRATVVALLKGHPKQTEWMDFVERELRFEFDSSVFPGGAWCEAPNYQGYTMHYLMIAMRVMQLNGFADFSTDLRFRATMDYFFRIQTPRDVRIGHHMLPTVGDTTTAYHSQSLQNVFAWAASLFAERDPGLAGRMMHAWKRGGSIVFGAHGLKQGAGWTQPLTLIDPDIAEVPPAEPLTSERLPGYGAILRNNYDTDRESYFLFKMGQADQHYDSDEGSFHWYALGRPVSLDFGSMYVPSIEQPWLHSTLDFDRRRAWTRGEVTRFVSLPSVDFCVGEMAVNDVQYVSDLPETELPEGVSSVIERGKRFVDWQRGILFVKGPDYVVIRDDLDDADNNMPTGWSVQVLASDVELDGSRARCTGQYGVDLEVLLAEPPGVDLGSSRWGYEIQRAPEWIPGASAWDVAEMQIALHASAPPDADYLAAMVPHVQNQPAPVVTKAATDAIRVVHAGGDDLVLFAGQRGLMAIEGVTFSGRVGLVRRTDQATTLHIIDGISMRVPEMIAQFPGPVTLVIQEGRIWGVCDGQARTCFLHWTDPPPTPATLTIDGQSAYVYSTFDGYLSFTVPAGAHQFEVRYPSKTLP